ncbi:hypothetical protein [Nocardioides sp. TF02-7]|uniref:homing endonuclease associated repeat-containing protein n=1 Tax=Nocardioides sp. TF02-7 TaxID=2917724 RepID=UPI001F056418|nr:hypothetical protein [Nocardioides sp. TF02-7]UMG91671.1 hypothetical protein MF408_16500 [Nocardioides sp. TF02-7]
MAPAQKYTDEQLLRALRRAAEVDGVSRPMTQVRYDELRVAFDGPSGFAVIRRYGTWRAALQAAGLPANRASARRPNWTEAELLEWLRRFLAHPTAGSSYSAYVAWAQTTRDAPSGPTIRNKFGKWSTAVAAAAGED